MDFEEAVKNFGKALGDLKRSYAEKVGENPNYISVYVDGDNTVTIIPTLEHGLHYHECYRGWLDTDL